MALLLYAGGNESCWAEGINSADGRPARPPVFVRLSSSELYSTLLRDPLFVVVPIFKHFEKDDRFGWTLFALGARRGAAAARGRPGRQRRPARRRRRRDVRHGRRHQVPSRLGQGVRPGCPTQVRFFDNFLTLALNEQVGNAAHLNRFGGKFNFTAISFNFTNDSAVKTFRGDEGIQNDLFID